MTDNKAPVTPVEPQQPIQEDSVHFLDYWQILYSRKEIVIAVTFSNGFSKVILKSIGYTR